MSARDTVIGNLVTALQAITAANGYHTTVKKVSKGALAQDVVSENCPFIAVIQGDEKILVHDATHVRFAMDIGVVAYLKGYTSSGMSVTINNLADDIKRLICAPVSLGTYCLDVQIKESGFEISDVKNEARAGIGLEVTYYAPIATF